MKTTTDAGTPAGLPGGGAALYSKLKPRKGRTRADVSVNQLQRLHLAMIELVDEGGYRAVTVRGLVRRAGVSSRAFYEHFANLDACFVATYDLLIRRAGRTFAAEVGGGDDIGERVRSAFEAFADAIVDEPMTARFTVVAAPAAGSAVLEPMRHSIQGLGTSICRYLSRDSHEHLPPVLVHGIIAGVLRVARVRLLSGREAELPGLAAEMTDWALALRADRTELEALAQIRSRPDRRTSDEELERPLNGDERAMILAATDRLSSSGGFDRLSVPRIRSAAGLSRKSFEAQFKTVKECFLEALEMRAGRAFAASAQEGTGRGSWPAGVHRTIAGLCSRTAREPVQARAVFVEVFAAGEDGLRCRERLIGEIGEYLRDRAPADQKPSALEAEVSAAAVWALIHYHVAGERTDRLPAIAPMLSYLVLAPAIGARAAVEAIASEEGRQS